MATVRQALEDLEGMGVMVTGIVLNNFNVRRTFGAFYERLSYRYYGYGYGSAIVKSKSDGGRRDET